MVTLEERWLADVGFGDSFLKPLRLDETQEQIEGAQAFKIVTVNSDRVMSKRNAGHNWEPQYRFTLNRYDYSDYEGMCRYHQTSPESHFTQNLVCSRATEDGRITLSGMRLITTTGPEQIKEEVALPDQDEYNRVLRDQFGIVMK